MAASEVSGGGWTAGKQLRRRELGAGVLFGREHSWVIAHDIAVRSAATPGAVAAKAAARALFGHLSDCDRVRESLRLVGKGSLEHPTLLRK